MLQVTGSSSEAREIAHAAALVKLGAPLQVVESETRLPRERLLRVYQDTLKKLPAREMAPIPVDWFMTWQANTHASVFLILHDCLSHTSDLDEVDALVCSYQVYREQLKVLDLPAVLSITHAWRLVKFVDAGMLALTPCTRCEGAFVVPTPALHAPFVCVPCQAPSRGASAAAVQDGVQV